MSFYLSIKGSPRARMAVGIALIASVTVCTMVVAQAVDLGLRWVGAPGPVASGVSGALAFVIGWQVLWPIGRAARTGKPIWRGQRVPDEDGE